eukprot:scaffold28784_cov112-Isochrysis_galbana.AAC.2
MSSSSVCTRRVAGSARAAPACPQSHDASLPVATYQHCPYHDIARAGKLQEQAAGAPAAAHPPARPRACAYSPLSDDESRRRPQAASTSYCRFLRQPPLVRLCKKGPSPLGRRCGLFSMYRSTSSAPPSL